MNPGFNEARLNLAALSLNNRDYKTAEENFRAVLQPQPKNYEAAIGLGVALRGGKKIDEAEAQYNEAQKLDPSNPSSYFNLGLLYQEYKDGQKPTLQKAQGYYRQFLSHANQSTPASLQKEAEKRIKDIDEIYVALEEAAKMQAEAEAMQKKAEEQQKQMEEQMKKQEADEAAAAAKAKGGAGRAEGAAAAAPRRRRGSQGRRQARADGAGAGAAAPPRMTRARPPRARRKRRSRRRRTQFFGNRGADRLSAGVLQGQTISRSRNHPVVRTRSTGNAGGQDEARHRNCRHLRNSRPRRRAVREAMAQEAGAAARWWSRQAGRRRRHGPRTRRRPSTTSKTTWSKAISSVPTASSSNSLGKTQHSSLIEIRKDFIPEMLKSLEDV